jgi:hypothetical protein
VDAAGVGEVDLVVVVDVAGGGEDGAAAGGGGGDGMGVESPVAEVDDVDVLLDENVSGEGAEEDPVAETPLVVVRGAGGGFFGGGGGVVPAGSCGGFAEGAGMNALDDGGDGRSSNPTSTLSLPLTRLAISRAVMVWGMSTPTGFSQ